MTTTQSKTFIQQELESLNSGQYVAATTTGQPVQLSAGAGAGKTKTLTTRLMYAFSDESGPFIKEACRVMGITFTQKAAAELAHRVRVGLAKAGLIEASQTIDEAWISTTDSMCRRILRENALSCGVDPDFDLLDPLSAEASMRRIITETLETFHQVKPIHDLKMTWGVRMRTHIASLGANDKNTGSFSGKTIDNALVLLMSHLITEINFDRAFDLIVANELNGISLGLRSADEPANSVGSMTSEEFVAQVSKLLTSSQLREALEVNVQLNASSSSGMTARRIDQKVQLCTSFAYRTQQIHEVLESIQAQGGAKQKEAAQRFAERLSELEQAFSAEQAATSVDPYDLNVRYINKIAKIMLEPACVPSKRGKVKADAVLLQALCQEIIAGQMQEYLSVLCNLALLCVLAYLEYCDRESKFDFATVAALTRFALKKNDAVRERMSGAFDMVMVDEFQDTNALQLDIIEQLADADLANLCTVGDEQQSIYAFRGSEVEMYRAHRQSMVEHGASMLELDANYRSHQAILDFVNTVFTQDGIPTNDLIKLKAMREEPKTPVVPQDEPRIIVLDARTRRGARNRNTSEDDELKVPQRGRKLEEARHHNAVAIAEEFAHLRDDHGVPAGDMVILLSKMTNSQLYIDALAKHGFDVVVQGGSVFFTSCPEVKELFALASLLVDPLDDESFLGAGLSSLGGLTEQDLAFIAANSYLRSVEEKQHAGASSTNKNSSSYSLFERSSLLVQRFNQGDDTLIGTPSQALQDFVVSLKDAQQALKFHPLSTVILGMVRFGAYLKEREKSVDSQKRAQAANIRKFISFVQDIERTSAGARDVLRKLSDLYHGGAKEAPAAADTADAVRIMTIHASKGLEFPVVAVGEIEVPKSRSDQIVWVEAPHQPPRVALPYGQKRLIAQMLGCLQLDEKKSKPLTVEVDGLDSIDPDVVSALSYAHDCAQTLSKAYAEEEFRKYYVAMTRARDVLIVALSGEISKSQGDAPTVHNMTLNCLMDKDLSESFTMIRDRLYDHATHLLDCKSQGIEPQQEWIDILMKDSEVIREVAPGMYGWVEEEGKARKYGHVAPLMVNDVVMAPHVRYRDVFMEYALKFAGMWSGLSPEEVGFDQDDHEMLSDGGAAYSNQSSARPMRNLSEAMRWMSSADYLGTWYPRDVSYSLLERDPYEVYLRQALHLPPWQIDQLLESIDRSGELEDAHGESSTVIPPLDDKELRRDSLDDLHKLESSRQDREVAMNFGSAFHHTMEVLALADDQLMIDGGINESYIDLVIKMGEDYGLDQVHLERLTLSLANWIKGDLREELSIFKGRLPEQEFVTEVTIPDELRVAAGSLTPVSFRLNGSIDLLLVHPGDMTKATVLDYKTGLRLFGEERMQEVYLHQAQTYAYACLKQGYKQVEVIFTRVECQEHTRFCFAVADIKELEHVLAARYLAMHDGINKAIHLSDYYDLAPISEEGAGKAADVDR